MVEEARVIWIESYRTKPLPKYAWQDVHEPGAYVEIDTGDLYRIPAEALFRQSSLLILQESTRPARLVQISEYPFIPTPEARRIAWAHHLQVNF